MKILTFNIWGAPYAKKRSARIQVIAEKLKILNPDILLFQEVYLPNNRKELIELLKPTWRHYHYFPSSLVGSGLLTMSKYPIIDAHFHKFRMQGKPDDLLHGDYYAGKGIGLTRISSPDGMVDVYNCHTHAQYDPDNDNEYAVYTETNLYEVTRFIDSNSGASPVVLCGDLNTRPDQAGYRIVTQLGALVDSYVYLNKRYPITLSNKNPYTDSINQCLDYILVRNISVGSVSIVMNEHLTGDVLAYSDHYGLLADIKLNGERLNNYDNHVKPVIEALYGRVNNALIETESQQIKHIERSILSSASIFDVVIIGVIFKRISKKLQAFLRWLSIFSAIGFGLWQLIQAGLNLQSRKSTLEGIQQELKKQIEAKRLFDGREL